MKNIFKIWRRLESIGVDSSMSYLESRKIKMLNLIALSCIPFTLMFSYFNWIEGRPLLSMINFANCTACIIALCLHWQKRYASARALLLVFNFIFFSLGSLLYQNGGEFFLLAILIVFLLVYDNRVAQIFASLLITSVIMFIIFSPEPILDVNPLPKDRIKFNVLGAIAFVSISIVFFKEIQYSYQAKIEEQRKELKTMNATMENIFYIISHDIRSPLSSVQDMLSMFQNNMISEKTVRENIPVINNRVTQLNESLNNLLKWSARNMNGIKSSFVDVAVSDLLQEAFYFIELQSAQKSVTIETSVDDSFVTHVDRDQMVVVLRNVISNAIKFSYIGGSIGIFVEYVESLSMIVVRIVDEGTGMGVDKLEHLFEDLQMPEIGTNGERGTGLGLWLCRELLRQNNGNLTVSSQQNIGSTFTIYIPGSRAGKVIKKDVLKKEKVLLP